MKIDRGDICWSGVHGVVGNADMGLGMAMRRGRPYIPLSSLFGGQPVYLDVGDDSCVCYEPASHRRRLPVDAEIIEGVPLSTHHDVTRYWGTAYLVEYPTDDTMSYAAVLPHRDAGTGAQYGAEIVLWSPLVSALISLGAPVCRREPMGKWGFYGDPRRECQRGEIMIDLEAIEKGFELASWGDCWEFYDITEQYVPDLIAEVRRLKTELDAAKLACAALESERDALANDLYEASMRRV